MRALIASLAVAALATACGGKNTTTTTSRVEETGGPIGTGTTDPDPTLDADPQPAGDITLAEAETTVGRIVELMAELADNLRAGDCTQLVPAYNAWNDRHADEQAELEEVGAKIPPAWANGELVDYFLKMEEHQNAIRDAVVECRCDATVQHAFGIDASKFECP